MAIAFLDQYPQRNSIIQTLGWPGGPQRQMVHGIYEEENMHISWYFGREMHVLNSATSPMAEV